MQPSNNDRGFTLVEVLVATVVLTVALVSMAELMAITLRMQQLGRNQTAAARMAQDKIDELMNQNFNTSPSVMLGGSLTANVANYNDVPSPGYLRRWLVQAAPADPGVSAANAARLLTVTVIPTATDTRTTAATTITTIIRCWPCAIVP